VPTSSTNILAPLNRILAAEVGGGGLVGRPGADVLPDSGEAVGDGAGVGMIGNAPGGGVAVEGGGGGGSIGIDGNILGGKV
jgi:hypothetical protein